VAAEEARQNAAWRIRVNDDTTRTCNQDRYVFDDINDRRIDGGMEHRVNEGAACYGEFAIVADGVGGSVTCGKPGYVAQQITEAIAEALVKDSAKPLLDVIASIAIEKGEFQANSPSRYQAYSPSREQEAGEIDGGDRASACLVACQLVGGDQLQVYSGGDCSMLVLRPKLCMEHQILIGTNGHDIVIHRQRQLQCKYRDRMGRDHAGPFEQLGMGYEIRPGSFIHNDFSGQNSVNVEEGDVILMFSDGLENNLAFLNNVGVEIPKTERDLHQTQFNVQYDPTLLLVNKVLQWWWEGINHFEGRLDPERLVRWLLRQSSDYPDNPLFVSSLVGNPRQYRDDVTVVVGIVEAKPAAAIQDRTPIPFTIQQYCNTPPRVPPGGGLRGGGGVGCGGLGSGGLGGGEGWEGGGAGGGGATGRRATEPRVRSAAKKPRVAH
jgi:serine/threonine protein phosphatase PrpC